MHKIEQNRIRISVRNLVEFVLRSGDLDNRHSAQAQKDAMLEGTRIHRKIQRNRMEQMEYEPEVMLKRDIPYKEVVISLEGRADGVYTNEDQILCIEEIKGVYWNIAALEEPIPVHEAQAVCYAYMLTSNEDGFAKLDGANVIITYCDLDTEEVRQMEHYYSADQLKAAFFSLIEDYGKWAMYQYHHRLVRNSSIENLEFPFPYRKGQRDVVVSAYKAMTRGKDLFVQAPTGIGKTMSSVFPAIRAVGSECADKIFYLTAKTITRGVAGEAMEILAARGLKASAITLYAKEKICYLAQTEGREPDCNPDSCPYAKGYYDRVNDAVYDLITNETNVSREIILQYAQKYQVCPFEMSLDVTYWMDVIICDYNYVFDPHVRLQRYFSEGTGGDYLFLIDEAHNLVERSRSMYSAALDDRLLGEALDHYTEISKKLGRSAKALKKCMLDLKRSCDTYIVYDRNDIAGLEYAAERLYSDIQKYEQDHPNFNDREGSKYFFALRDFVEVYSDLEEDYRLYGEHTPDGNFVVRLFCVQPSRKLKECLDKGISSLFFSATLLPMRYYKEVLKGHNDDYAIYVRSPFDTAKRLICFGSDVTAKYTMRTDEQYMKMVDYILLLARARVGNYMVFVPSFAYLTRLMEIIDELEPDVTLLCQEPDMTEEDREVFLQEFAQERNGTLIGLCVIGGVFSEGIDLTNDKLIGVVIIGTGLPQICPEKEVLRQYYDEQGQNGFDYAYRFPGMNRVLQSAGRLIRTDEDHGVIALLDYRILGAEYRSLYPEEWYENSVRVTRDTIGERAESFWNNL